MSRKREQQRESRRELARQLGVSAGDVPDELRAHARVTEPTLSPSLTVERARRGLLQRARPLALHLVLFVVDGTGTRVARVGRYGSVGTLAPGEVALTLLAPPSDDLVRYTRPGHFVLVALLTEGADDAASARHGPQLCDATALRIRFDAFAGNVDAAEVKRSAEGRAVQLEDAAGPIARDPTQTFCAAGLISIAAAHRVHDVFTIPLRSEDGRLVASLKTDVRL